MRSLVPYVVPLLTQAVAILAEIQPLTGVAPLVFPNVRISDRPMCENMVALACVVWGKCAKKCLGADSAV